MRSIISAYLVADFPILAVTKPKLFPPIVEMPEYLEPASLHSCEHVHETSFNTDCLLSGWLKGSARIRAAC